MASSNARKFDFKPREQLDLLVDEFERDVDHRLQELRTHLDARAESILSMTGADDDRHVCNRIDAILHRRGLRGQDLPER
ncbi:hypothetical protein [Agrilutibacter solisilvae]|uniref:Uncharacterized protein n=1 Tax=Agrilutibacter solisilvae TaxID=2763317 RepID=A0A974Y4G6_9GAMM|nr:hypothetical protein [Lysobacter solisilvae]QSX77761.1 hypothetical protein I8J32_013630 [Lysobacter solisilvae]